MVFFRRIPAIVADTVPIKNTVGEGFSVEELVVASIACHLLTGLPWPGADGALILSIECQKSQDGWFFDDVVVQVDRYGTSQFFGCSVKSYPVFGPQGAPKELVQALWKQWRATSPRAFQQERDRLVLIAAQHEPAVREAWFELTESARVTDPDVLAARQTDGTEPSARKRDAFASLLKSDPAEKPRDGARLVRSLHLIEHDFQHVSSQSATHCVGICQQALSDAARDHAGALWQAIIDCVAPTRRKGGRIMLADLLDTLGTRFPLKHHPRYAADLGSLGSQSRERMQVLPVRIANAVSFDRANKAEAIEVQAEKHRCIAVVGASGNGKSVLARNWALKSRGPVWWIRAADLSQKGGLRAAFGLKHSVADLINNSAQGGRIVLDGLDKCFDEPAFDEAALLLTTIAQPEAKARWQIVITCCPEDWERVRRSLLRRSVTLSGDSVAVDCFTSAELREACQKVPTLTGLAQRPHLWAVLRWPKALDLVATYGQGAGSSAQWASESDFAHWFWSSIISQDKPVNARDRVARKLGVYLGDHMTGAAPLDRFDQAEIEPLNELAREGHLEVDRQRNKVRFSHEILADWARTRELQIGQAPIATFLAPRLQSPLWHRAVRYHALGLLEGNTDAQSWLNLLEQFKGNATTDDLCQTLLLEAPIFALDQAGILKRLWSKLEADNGELLRRFLRQFLRVGTIPDPLILRFYRDESPERLLDLASHYRVPWAPYWFGVMKFLGTQAERVTELAPEESAELALLWLQLCKATSHGMDAAATLAITGARRFYQSGKEDYASANDVTTGEKICRALMAAAPVSPGPVTELVLKLSGRRLPLPGEQPPEEIFSRPEFMPERGDPKPWPDGPVCDPNGAFVRAFMDGQYSAPLFFALPEVGAEAMFSVLLDLPYANDGMDEDGLGLEEHGFNHDSDMPRSVFWMNGPFVAFLNANPAVALPAIIRLVNFATDRAGELPPGARTQISVPVRVGEEVRPWRGHTYSYAWSKGHVFGPRMVGCALLSLEKWLYLHLEEKKPIDGHLATIIELGRSIALAGVLVSVGKFKPELFLGPLKSIVEALEFSWIERQLRAETADGYMGASFDFMGSEIKHVQEWVGMPHRKEALNEIVLKGFLTQRPWREMIEEFMPRWQQRLADKDTPPPEFFASTVSQFDLANWTIEERDGKQLIIYTPPADLPKLTAEEEAQMERTRLLLFIPMECRKILHGEQESSEEKLAGWWRLIPTIEAQKIPEEQQDYRSATDALFGIVAVAVVKHPTWLAADPQRQKEAGRILFDLKPRPSWATPDALIDYKWDDFAAFAMTSLWCDEPNAPLLRQGVGGLAMWQRYGVVERVLLIAAAKREQLGAAFEQLLAHALRYAPIRDRVNADRNWGEKSFDHTAVLQQHYEAFAQGTTEPMPKDWNSLATPKPAGHHNHSGGMDIPQINAVLRWAEDLSLARDAGEKEAWIGMHRQALLCALVRLDRLRTMISENGEDADFSDERWAFKGEEELLKRLGQIVARMAPGENHRVLWETLFAFGALGDRWIDAFLGGWFLEAGGHDTPQPAMAEQWKAMLDYAAASPAWSTDEYGWRVGRELHEDLLGFRTLGWQYWDERLVGVVPVVREHHESWARKHAHSRYDTNHYLIFLGHRATRGIRIGGLMLYHQHAPMDDANYWGDTDIQDGFANALRLALNENWSELAASKPARDAFMAIALKLASLQHSLGSELLTTAASRFGALG